MTAVGLPRDLLFGRLLGDSGIELASRGADLDSPVSAGVIALRDLIPALHELREGLELDPLVVHGVDGPAHVTSPFDRLIRAATAHFGGEHLHCEAVRS
jgi:hypothetical protein